MNWEAIFWLVALVVFIFAEAATVTLVSIWFAVGALAAIVVALLGGGMILAGVRYYSILEQKEQKKRPFPEETAKK